METKLLILHDSVFLFSYLERYFKYFKGSIELHKNFFTENEVKIYGHSNEDSYLKKLTILKEGIRASYLNASVDIREDPVFKKWFESVLDSDHANFPKQGYGIDFFDEDFLENFYIGKADIFLDELKFKDAFEMLCDIRLLAEYKKATDKKCTLFLSNPCLFNMEKIAEYIKTIKAKSFIVLRQMNSKGLLRSRFIKGIPYFPSDILYFSEHDMRDVEPFIFGDQITSFELARRIEEEKYGVNQIEEYLANYRSFLYTDFQEKNIEEKIEDIKNESFSSIDFRVKKELSKEVLSFFMNKKIKNIDHKAELTPEQRLEPTLLLKTKLGDGKIINQKPIFKDPVMIENKKIWNIVIEAMQKVVTSTNPWGTARIRFGTDEKYTVAAKTGTAQVFSNHNRDEDALGNTKIPKKLRNHSLFIAFAPIKNPKIAIAVIVEHSPIAGTVARKVLDYYLLKENEKDEKIPSKT